MIDSHYLIIVLIIF